MKRLLAVFLAVIMLAAMIPATSLAASQYATVVGGWLRLRAGASFEADTITSYYTDTVVEILGAVGEWYRVKTPDGRSGYMYGDFLRLGVGSTSAANAFVTSHNGYGVRMRKGPGTGYRVIRTYAVGTPVTVLERGNYWCRISINGTVGYMMSQFLNFGSESGNGNQSALCYASVWSANGYGVRLRSGPGKGYGKIGVYSVGTVVAVLEKGEVWDRIRVGSRTGWMMNEFLRYQNAYEMTGVTLNTMDPTVGTVMKVQAMTPASATVSYAWLVGDTVKGTNSTYTVSAADVGKRIQLKLSGTGNYSGMVVSAATNAVISNTQISGLRLNTTAPVVGDELTASFTPENATVAYAWKVNGYQVANGSKYMVTVSDVGKTIELIVSGTGNYSGTLSASTSAVAASSTVNGVVIRNESNTEVGAAPVVGDRLIAAVSPAQATVSYQWKRDGVAISGATSASYVLTEADQGAQMSVTVNGTGAYAGEKSASISERVSARPAIPAIDDYTMPGAVVGQTYATQLTAQGGGQITWTLASGELPAGLTLSASGTITGVAEQDGIFTFAVKAANAAGNAEKTFTITVAPAAEPRLTIGGITLPAMTVGYEQPAPISVSITNTGNAAAQLELLYTEGGSAAYFKVNEDGRSMIAAGETDTSWTIQPVAGLTAGTYTTEFVVRYHNGETVRAAVSFTVTSSTEPSVQRVLTVVGGTADKTSCTAGETISITAGEPEEGKRFSGWTASGTVVFADASAAATTMTMPDFDVTVTATYTEIPTPEVPETPETPEVPEAKAQLEIEEINLGTLEEGYAQPAPTEIEIRNTGNADAVLTVLYPEGGNASAFIVNEDGRTVIAAGTANTSWNLQPKAGLEAGTYTTDFVVEYNGATVRVPVTFKVKAKEPVTWSLTVENGSGSGNYTENQSVSVKAADAPEGKVFDKWTATAGSVSDASSAETTFVMPAGDAVLTAVYKEVEKAKLGTAVITWSEDGTSVSWTAVPGADSYRYYRLKADGTETSRKITDATTYTFQNAAVPNDVFYVQALDSTGASIDGEYASAMFE